MERKVEKYTVRDLILGTREAYLKQYAELDKLHNLVKPITGSTADIQFRLKGSIISADLVCDVIKNYNRLERLLKIKRDKKIYSYSLQSYGMIPYIHKDAEKFEEIKEGIVNSDYFQNMGSVVTFRDNNSSYLLQTTVEDIRFQKLAKTEDKQREILYKEGDSLYLGENTEIADALNLLNTRLPADLMPDYHVSLMDKVENPFALRVVDVRKANEIKDTKSVVVLAKKM
jgi:hypothetical protein